MKPSPESKAILLKNSINKEGAFSVLTDLEDQFDLIDTCPNLSGTHQFLHESI